MLLKRLDHVLYRCADLNAERAFYENLGFKQSWSQDDGEWIHLFSGSSYVSLRRAPAIGFNNYVHMGWQTADLAACRKHLKAANIPIKSETQTREGDHLYIEDPDGFEIELVEYRNRPAYARLPGQSFLRLDHTRFNVADLEKSVCFYRDTLGAKITWSNISGWDGEGVVPSGVTWVHLTFGDSYISLGQADSDPDWGAGKEAAGPPRFIHSGWAVDSLDAVAARLDDLNVARGQPIRSDAGRHIYLNDAEGIVEHGTNLELTEYSEVAVIGVVVDRLFSEPSLAELYDAFCEGRPDFSFYLPLVMSAESVLDVGCGTGELLRSAREAGHTGRLCGLDPAAAMLQVARRRPDIEWVLGDLASVDWDREFDLVVMTGHAFQVFVEDDQLRASLAAIRSALAEHGCFVFETRNPLVRGWETWTPDNAVEIAHDGAVVRMAHEVETLFDGNVVSFTSTYTSPSWDQPQVSRSTLRFLDADSLSSFLSGAGLAIEEQFGDWDRQPLTDTSPEIITIARRG